MTMLNLKRLAEARKGLPAWRAKPEYHLGVRAARR